MKTNRFRKALEFNARQQPYDENQIRQFEPIQQPQQQEPVSPEIIQEIQRMQMEEQLRQQQMNQAQYQPAEPNKDEGNDKSGDNPLSILDEIRARPSAKGTFPMLIGGRPLDLHVLEDYITKISPFALKTILRYHNARTIEEIKGYTRGGSLKIKSGTIILILLAVGMGIAGIIVMLYMPQIMAMFQGGI